MSSDDKPETTIWAVVHRTQQQRVVCLFITGVPGNARADSIRRAIAHCRFGDCDVPWADYLLIPQKKWDEKIRDAWNHGNVDRIAYADLAPHRRNRRFSFTLRLSRDMHARVHRIARIRGISAHTVLIEAVAGYVRMMEAALGIPYETSDSNE